MSSASVRSPVAARTGTDTMRAEALRAHIESTLGARFNVVHVRAGRVALLAGAAIGTRSHDFHWRADSSDNPDLATLV